MSKEQWNVDDFLGLVMDLWYNVFDKELKALKLKFQQYDANADGTLNFDEFVTVTKRLFPSLARNFSQREMTELYSSFSGDDGVISEEEFFIAIQRLFRESVSLANISASTSVEDKLKSLATGVSGWVCGVAALQFACFLTLSARSCVITASLFADPTALPAGLRSAKSTARETKRHPFSR